MEQLSLADITPNDEILLSNASLYYVREYVYEGDWLSFLHAHNHAEIFYITKGKGSFRFDSGSCEVSVGDLLIINAHVHHTETSSKEPLGYIVLGTKGLEAFYDEDKAEEYILLKSDSIKQGIFPLLKSMLYESKNADVNSEAICRSILKAVLLILLRHVNIKDDPTDNAYRRITVECAAIKRYINAHFKENITLDDLAKHRHISKYYLIHSFKKEYGISPINYLQHCRIKEGQKLLEETQLPTSQISNILGFSSPSQFSQCFKRLTGLSPSDFRKKRI